jgi:hypothetical protein
VPGEDICVYLADERELGEPGTGNPISGEIALNLPDGAYRVACFDPQVGLYSPALKVRGGPDTRLEVPPFVHDLLVRVTRVSS